MKPRTKEQERIVRWTNQHDGPTPKQAAYARRHCFTENILESRNVCLCTACKHTWHVKDTSEQKITCPHCGQTLSVIFHRKKIHQSAYFMVLTTKAGMQVAHWYLAKRTVSRAEDDVLFYHVGSEWVRQDGKRFSVELPRFTMGWYKDQWVMGAHMELRQCSFFARYLLPSATYCARILPIAKRNGWKRTGRFENWNIELICCLLANKNFESWFKVGHYGVCSDWIMRKTNNMCGHAAKPEITDGWLTLIRLANRKHIVFESSDMWRDYVDYVSDLKYMQMDYHNPQILFPKDFQKAHAELARRANLKRERDRERYWREVAVENARKSAENDAKKQAWITKYAQCFSNMALCVGSFKILPLISMDDFKDESKHMHHCIATYYGKLDTLLLSIEHDGKKCETAEINLLGAGQIMQCRGVNNQPSDYHDDIVNILKGYMSEFVKRYNKPAVQPTLPVPISLYRQYQIAI